MGHRALTPVAGVPDSDLSLLYKKLRDLRWKVYFDNQFGKYAEETFAQSKGTNSLSDGLRYLSARDPEGAKRLGRYGLTPKGIRVDAAKLAVGTGAGIGAALAGASALGSHAAKAYDELLEAIPGEAEAAQPARRVLASRSRKSIGKSSDQRPSP